MNKIRLGSQTQLKNTRKRTQFVTHRYKIRGDYIDVKFIQYTYNLN